MRRQEEEGTGLLLPVLLDNCALPEIISERRYYDLSDPLKEPEVVQTLLNQILGIKPFSQRIRDFLNEPDGTSPYDQNARRRGRLLLQEAARFRDLKISRNQKWLPWELFHNLLNRYTCTLRLGRSFGAADDYSFLVIDRWNNTASSITLTEGELNRGLWRAEVNLNDKVQLTSRTLSFLENGGRLSLNSDFNPDVKRNPVKPTSQKALEGILANLVRAGKSFDEGSRQSFLFDLQRLIWPVGWHKVTIIVGSVRSRETLADSYLTPNAPSDGVSAVLELYDSFFCSMKYTLMHRTQMAHHWEADVDLFSSESETRLALA